MPLTAVKALGAICLPQGGVRFRVWAPACRTVSLQLESPHPAGPLPLRREPEGWFELTLPELGPGARYTYLLDDQRERPDPAARSLPEGVHGPSETVDTSAFAWSDAGWRGVRLPDLVLYELHVGTFTAAGTFDAAIPRLPALRDLGVTAIELMPVASFPGARNWGYDGVGLYAPQRTYGGPAGLQRLIDACHRVGLAVVLDVVYNHFGPEGNYLAEFGPYYTDRYRTPWGQALNYDGPDAAPVRQFVIDNALYWVREYHVDGLRLDAVHGIFDRSPVHILRELNDAVQGEADRLGRRVHLIAESDLNDRRIVAAVSEGGFGLAAQWSDDFHHALHTLLTGERQGYYADFGSLEQLAQAYEASFVYAGQHSAFRGRPHGTPVQDLPPTQFVVCAQNHDQTGNRARGERLTALVDFEALKLAAAAVLLAPYIPLLFMGEEYGEPAPFLFFTDFEDAALREAVRRGRRQEFQAFGWTGEVPDPQAPETFQRSKLEWERQFQPPHARLRALYGALLALRRACPLFQPVGPRPQARRLDPRVLLLRRSLPDGAASTVLLNFSPEAASLQVPFASGVWRRLLDTAAERFGGSGPQTPARAAASPGAPIPIRLPGWGAVAYVRDAADAPATP
jgi:maltooligosyltrehalose trehalohydrolase